MGYWPKDQTPLDGSTHKGLLSTPCDQWETSGTLDSSSLLYAYPITQVIQSCEMYNIYTPVLSFWIVLNSLNPEARLCQQLSTARARHAEESC